MSKQTKPTQTLTINYQADVPLKMDDVLYVVETTDDGRGSKTFYQTCRVCGGKRELTINGATFRCPCCEHEQKSITVHKYIVRRHRVHKVEVSKGTDTWKPSNFQTVKFGLYKKSGRGYFSTTTREIRNPDINPAEPLRYDDPIFTDYALAVAAAKAFNEREAARLADYNELHGTHYEIPAEFADIKNDDKSI